MKSDTVYLAQINDCIKKIKDFTRETDFKKFSTDQKTQSAVIMQLAIIGELAKKISKETKVQIDLPWREIAGFRDRAIHNYYQIDLGIVWQTIKDDLKILENSIKTFLTL